MIMMTMERPKREEYEIIDKYFEDADDYIDFLELKLGIGDIVKFTRDDVSELIINVCNFYKVTPKQIIGSNRKSKYVFARQVISFLLKFILSNYTYQQIGYFLDRDHSTIVYLVKKFKLFYEIETEYRDSVNEFVEEYYGDMYLRRLKRYFRHD